MSRYRVTMSKHLFGGRIDEARAKANRIAIGIGGEVIDVIELISDPEEQRHGNCSTSGAEESRYFQTDAEQHLRNNPTGKGQWLDRTQVEK